MGLEPVLTIRSVTHLLSMPVQTHGRELQFRMEKSAPVEESLRLTGELGCLLFLYSLADPSNLLKLMESIQHDISAPIDPVQIIQETLTRMNLDEDQKHTIVQKWKFLMDVHNRQLKETMRCQEVKFGFL